MKTRARLAVVAAILFCSASACSVGPDYHRPKLDLAASFAEPPVAAREAADEAAWWESFGDPALARLVRRAVVAAPRMREALARVREARELRAADVGAFFPQIKGKADYNNSRISENGFFKSIPAPASTLFNSLDIFETSFDAQWEIDVFGHVRRTVEAAGDELAAAEAGAEDVRRSLAAETAREIVEIRSYDERLRIAESNIGSQGETLDILRERRHAGVASEAEVARADAQLASTQSEIPALRARRAGSLHRLEALVAAPSGTLDAELAPAHGIPQPAELPRAGLPSDLLLHRPDVARAESELAAATARIGIARSELLPRFSLTGSFGVQSQTIGDLLTSDSRLWYVGPGMQWPIFSAGRLRAAARAATARAEQSAARYEIVVRDAIADVESSLAALREERTRESLLAREADDEALAADATRDEYRSGLTDLLHVLDAERERYRAEDALAASRQTLAEQAIALYKAVGGPWTPTASANAAADANGAGGADSAQNAAARAEDAGARADDASAESTASATAGQPAASRVITASAISSPRSVSATVAP